MPVAPTNLVLVISSRVDDGAVYYLNGQEVRRQRMTHGSTMTRMA